MKIPSHATKVFSGIIYDVYQWEQKMFDGSSSTFEMLKRPDTVKVIALLNDNVVLLQEEQPNDNKKLGLPGGRVNSGETTEQAALRELREETGYICQNLKLISTEQPVTKIDWNIHYFLGEVNSQIESQLDNGEQIQTQLVALDDFHQKIISFEIKVSDKILKVALQGFDEFRNLFTKR